MKKAKNFQNHLIPLEASALDALRAMNNLGGDTTLFVVGPDQKLVGSLTDGDVRRGLIAGNDLQSSVEKFINRSFRSLLRESITPQALQELRKLKLRLIPVVDDEGNLVDLINLKDRRSLLPVDAILMAGGEGKRLLPLTEKVPKPLLKVGERAIIEINIDRLNSYGINHYVLCVRHFSDQIERYLGNGEQKGIRIEYVHEKEAMGTIGALTLIEDLEHDVVLLMNSDLLTNIDFEDFYLDFIQHEADMSIASISYRMEVPYAIFGTDENKITSIQEKPEWIYYTNAGIYLFKRSLISQYIKEGFFNATDLVEALIADKKKVIYYSIRGYWLDIGRHEDYRKAQEDIKHIRL